MKKLYVYADFDWLKEIELVGELGYESLRGSDSYSFSFHDEWLRKHGDLFLSEDLNNYTVFAPTNDAMNEFGAVPANYEETEAKDFVERHLILNRKIFTDGQTTGAYTSEQGLSYTLSGAWDSFRLDTQYRSASVVPDGDHAMSNIQASNGVVHCIDNVLN